MQEQQLVRGLPGRRFRPELHGLRGLAILGVVLFHLFGAGRVSGGIDIFLAVSGFLFTAMLLREAAETGGRIDVGRYLSRLARRLLAPAVLVIGVTTVVGFFVMPVTDRLQLLAEARASLLYFENLELLRAQMSYEAAGAGTSPFQHFWSLSVQGQFYLVWPVVAILAVWIAKRVRRSATTIMMLLVGLVLVASLIYAIYMQTISQDQAYLMTRTRLWELAFGGLLALLAARMTVPAVIRPLVGWIGLGLVLTAGFALDGAQVFPGPLALWPLAGFAFIIISAGPAGAALDHPWTAAKLLSARLLAWIGDLAYGLYLWHWPLLIFYLEIRDYPAVGVRGGLLLFFLSLCLAWLTHRFVETPIGIAKALPQWRQLAVAGGGIAVGAAALSAVLLFTSPPIPDGYTMTGVDSEQYPGADAIESSVIKPVPAAEIYPALDSIAQDQPTYHQWGCRQKVGNDPGSGAVLVCEDLNKPENPSATVMLAGGSHAGQWHHAFSLLAEQNNWELLVVDKSGCRFGPLEDPENNTCDQWNRDFVKVVQERSPDLVVTPGTVAFQSGPKEHIWDGAPDRWEEITETGTDLLLMRATPRPEQDAPQCLASGKSPSECGPDFSVFEDQNPLEPYGQQDSIHTVDMTDRICPAQECPAVIGNVAVYRDDSHLTNAYVETLAPYLDEKLQRQIPDLY
nr:acyltransferase family protein [Nesterenkonia sp. LB17]